MKRINNNSCASLWDPGLLLTRWHFQSVLEKGQGYPIQMQRRLDWTWGARKGELPLQSLHFGDSMPIMEGKQKQYCRIWGTESAGKEDGGDSFKSGRASWKVTLKQERKGQTTSMWLTPNKNPVTKAWAGTQIQVERVNENTADSCTTWGWTSWALLYVDFFW